MRLNLASDSLAVSGGRIAFFLRLVFGSEPDFIFFFNALGASAPWEVILGAGLGADICPLCVCIS